MDSIIIVSPTTSDDLSHAHKAKKKKTSAASGDQELSRGLSSVSIIDIDDIDNPLDKRLNKSNPTADIKEFFLLAPHMPGQPKRRMKCNLCAYVVFFY